MEPTIPLEDLRAAGFGDEVERLGTAVAEYLDAGTGSNVAVVAEPYAGRGALLDYAASLLDGEAERVALEPPAADVEPPTLPDAAARDGGRAPAGGVGSPATSTDDDDGTESAGASPTDSGDADMTGALIVADCHNLFDRHIDGFEALDAFLERLALSDPLVVTAWNRHAWTYLDAVRDVGDSFPVTVEIPPLDADELRTVIEARCGPDLPDAVNTGRAGRVEEVVVDRYPVRLPGGRTVGIPYPKPNTAWLAARSVSGTEESVEAVVYEKLRRVSNGNPGVAAAIWKRSVRDGEIAPSYIEPPVVDDTLDDDAAFLLWNVVAMESARVDRLDALFEDRPVEPVLQRLVQQDLVTVADRTVSIAPASLPAAVDVLERRGLAW